MSQDRRLKPAYQQQQMVPRPAVMAKDELKVLFKIFDAEDVGTIDARELKAAFRALGVPATSENIKQMLLSLGRSSGDSIAFDEFCALAEARLPARDSKEAILQTFELFGGGEDGYIDKRQLRRVCDELGEQISEAELDLMISEADRDGDGRVDFQDFWIMMRRKYDPLADDDNEPVGQLNTSAATGGVSGRRLL